eukprot:2564944-Pyramimonas_sp.AAC.1
MFWFSRLFASDGHPRPQSRRFQHGPRGLQERLKRGPKRLQERPRALQERPKGVVGLPRGNANSCSPLV